MTIMGDRLETHGIIVIMGDRLETDESIVIPWEPRGSSVGDPCASIVSHMDLWEHLVMIPWKPHGRLILA